MSLAPDDPRHGTHNGYKNLRCRCPACTAAHTQYVREMRRQKRKGSCPDCGGPGGMHQGGRCRGCHEVATGKRPYRHHGPGAPGVSGYRKGCRCPGCEATHEDRADLAARWIAAHTLRELADERGVSYQGVQNLLAAFCPEGWTPADLRAGVLSVLEDDIRRVLDEVVGAVCSGDQGAAA